MNCVLCADTTRVTRATVGTSLNAMFREITKTIFGLGHPTLRVVPYAQVSNRKLKLFELLHESGILHFHKYPWGSQIPLSDKS